MRIAVVTPTIIARRRSRPLTTHQWVALGHTPILIEQPATMPVGHDSYGITARQALQAGLDTGADTIIFAEDDIDIDPTIPLDIPRGVIVSYWSRPRFRRTTTEVWAPARERGRWWGSQCFATDRDTAARLIADTTPGGIDMALRRIDVPLLATTRPYVEHRAVRRAATTGPHITSGGDYRGPNSHNLATSLWGWLPGRRDRRRVASPTVAEANGIATAHQLQWLIPALQEMGHIIRDKPTTDTWHRGITPPWVSTPEPARKEDTLW